MISTHIKSLLPLLLGCLGALSASQCRSEITVTLKERVAVNDTQITIEDVADISGGSANDRSHIAQLDLDVIEDLSQTRRLSRREIELRMRVSGYRAADVRVIGPKTVTVRIANTDEFRSRLETLLQDEFARQFGFERNDVSIRVSEEATLRSVESRISGTPFSATVLFDSQLPVGPTTIQVEFASQRDRFLQEFKAQVILSTNVAVASRNVPRGSVIDAGSIRVIKRPIVRKADFADPKSIMGRVAKVDILSNDVLLTSHLADTSQNRTSTVQRNDLIDVIVPLGGTQVRLKNARVIKAGNIGDTITVLNTASKNQLSARLVSQTEAIVSNDPRMIR